MNHHFLTLLWWLVVGHALADFALQSDAMALGKNRHLSNKTGVPWPYWLSAHAMIHGGTVAIILRSPVLGVFETMAHWVIDFGKCEGYYGIHIDQALHGACKLLWLGLCFELLMPSISGF
jgi:hypothetical protein